MEPALVFAFTAGAVATVNPCGFALLPAWFARQLAGRPGEGAARRVLRAVTGGLATTAGFVGVFAVAALVIGSGAAWLGAVLPWAGVALGGGLMAAGALWLFDLRLPGLPVVNSCRRASERFGAFGFGLSYGFISLSCSLPVFVAAAGAAFAAEGALSVANVLAYLAGAASVLLVIALIAAVSGAAALGWLGTHGRGLRRFSGALTALAGVYVFLYWGQLLFGDAPWMREILDRGGSLSAGLARFLSEGVSPAALLLALAGVMLLGWWLWQFRPAPASRPSDAHET